MSETWVGCWHAGSGDLLAISSTKQWYYGSIMEQDQIYTAYDVDFANGWREHWSTSGMLIISHCFHHKTAYLVPSKSAMPWGWELGQQQVVGEVWLSRPLLQHAVVAKIPTSGHHALAWYQISSYCGWLWLTAGSGPELINGYDHRFSEIVSIHGRLASKEHYSAKIYINLTALHDLFTFENFIHSSPLFRVEWMQIFKSTKSDIISWRIHNWPLALSDRKVSIISITTTTKDELWVEQYTSTSKKIKIHYICEFLPLKHWIMMGVVDSSIAVSI